jgi:hypothetical protein
MKTKITITLFAAASFLFPETIANAQTCGTSQVTYSGYTSGYLPKWNATTGCINNSTIFDNGEVGIGLTAPASRFHSAGQIRSGIPSGGLGGASATTGSLLFYNSSNTNTVNIQSGVTTTSYTMTLPATQGAASSVLTNNGSGGLDWAQLTVGSWLLAGNTLSGTLPASPAEFIGTLNAADWIIRTNNTEKMRVQSGGNVGIGTTAPLSKFDIVSTAAGSNIGMIISNYTAYGVGVGLPTARVSFGHNSTQTVVEAGNMAYIEGGNMVDNSSNEGFLALGTRRSNTITEAVRILNSGYVGIGLTNPAAKLDVNGTSNFTGAMAITGQVTVTGSGTYSGTWLSSDQMFKTNIDSLSDGLTIIRQLKPKTYYFDTLNFNEFNFSTKKSYGFLAQDISQILPELVSSNLKAAVLDTLGNVVHPSVSYKAVNYIELIPFLTKGIQEQQQQIDSLTTKTTNQDSINALLQNQVNQLTMKTNNQDSVNASLQNQLVTNNTLFQNQLNQLMTTITNCCNASMQSQTNNNQQNKSMIIPEGETAQLDVELSNAQIIILMQNSPNPFAERTSINYYLPDNTGKAQILFYNAGGKLIQSAEIIQKGKGTLNVFANDLSNGIYTYTLVVDGKVIETKKMVKQ